MSGCQCIVYRIPQPCKIVAPSYPTTTQPCQIAPPQYPTTTAQRKEGP
jgi:hypothetical protein